MESLEMPEDASRKTKEEKFARLTELGILDRNPLDDQGKDDPEDSDDIVPDRRQLRTQ